MIRLLTAFAVLALATGPTPAAPTHEATIEFRDMLQTGTSLRVENLIGTIQVRGGDPSEGVRIEGHVLAEAKTDTLARALAESVSFEVADEDGRKTVRLVYPTDRHRQFRVPAVGFGGMVGKWVTPLVRKSTVSLDYGGRQIQVTQQRGAAAISVDLVVQLPFDAEASLRQVVGSIDVMASRGSIALDVIEGRIDVEQTFGSLDIASSNGEVVIRNFQGERLEIYSGAGGVELSDVRVDRVRVNTATGFVAAQDVQSEDVQVNTGSGDVELAKLESRTLKIDSVSGSATVASRLRGMTDARIASETGDVVIRVVGDLGFDLTANTKSGDITIYRMELETLQIDGRPVARRGRGGATLDVSTPDGKFTVRPDDGSWTTRLASR